MPKFMPKTSDAAGGSKTPDEMAEEQEKRIAELTAQVAELTARSGNNNSQLVATRPARNAGLGSATFPMLTKTNYNNWSLLMKVLLQSRFLWTAVDTGTTDYTDDRYAMEALLRSVPPEMHGMLASKKTTKDAWDAIRTLRMGAERARESRAQTLRQQYDDVRFKPGEGVDDFGMRLQSLVNEMATVGEEVAEKKVLLKFLRVVPKKYKQLAWSIESCVDLSTMSLDELMGRLKVVEERDDEDGDNSSGGKLLLTE